MVQLQKNDPKKSWLYKEVINDEVIKQITPK